MQAGCHNPISPPALQPLGTPPPITLDYTSQPASHNNNNMEANHHQPSDDGGDDAAAAAAAAGAAAAPTTTKPERKAAAKRLATDAEDTQSKRTRHQGGAAQDASTTARETSAAVQARKTAVQRARRAAERADTTSATRAAAGGGCYTVTFGDVAENHVGMEKRGKPANAGISVSELQVYEKRLTSAGARNVKILDLVQPAADDLRTVMEDGNLDTLKAAVMVVRNGVDKLMGEGAATKLERELRQLRWDTQCLQRGRVVNKHTRCNLCFGSEHQMADFAAGKGTVYAWHEVPLLDQLRQRLIQVLDDPKVRDLQAEGNHYPDVRYGAFGLPCCEAHSPSLPFPTSDPSESGIGYHGDGERRIVIAVRVGEPIPQHYQW